jgi:hypothetical protein
MSAGNCSKRAKFETTSMGIGSWIVLLALLALLAGVGFVAYAGWTRDGDFAMPAAGYVALALGVAFSLVVGIGLMALLFYSSRAGYDQPPTLIVPAPDEAEHHPSRNRAMRDATKSKVHDSMRVNDADLADDPM